MPWTETSVLQERIRCVKGYQSGLYPMIELCARFGVSRQTGYKWLGRDLEQGVVGLEDRSRAPRHCPHRMSLAVERAILTDNVPPFASRGIHGLSQLSVWWIELGIQPLRTEPSHPEQNGAHERMHRTPKAETTRPPAPNPRAQRRRFDRFHTIHDEERPHEALGQKPPASCWRPSPRAYPERKPVPDDPERFEVRWVSDAGTFCWKSRHSHARSGGTRGAPPPGPPVHSYVLRNRSDSSVMQDPLSTMDRDWLSVLFRLHTTQASTFPSARVIESFRDGRAPRLPYCRGWLAESEIRETIWSARPAAIPAAGGTQRLGSLPRSGLPIDSFFHAAAE